MTTGVQARSDLDLLDELMHWFDCLDLATVPNEVRPQVKLLLAEGFTNAVRHAHHHQIDRPVDIEVALFSDRLELRIWDCGIPFDLDRMLKTRLETQDLDPFREHGRGLLLMYRIADFLIYRRLEDDRNQLLLIKLLPNTPH